METTIMGLYRVLGIKGQGFRDLGFQGLGSGYLDFWVYGVRLQGW